MGSMGGGKFGSPTSGTIFIIPDGGSIKFIDVRGFTRHEFTDTGDIKHTGKIGRPSR